MSAFDRDLRPVGVKMRQIIQDEKNEEKDKVKERQKRNRFSFFGRAHRRVFKAQEQEISFTEEYCIGCNKYYSAGRG